MDRRFAFAVMLALACHLVLFSLPGFKMQTSSRIIPPRRVSIRLIEPVKPAVSQPVKAVPIKTIPVKYVPVQKPKPVVVRKEIPEVIKKTAPVPSVPIVKPVPVVQEKKQPVVSRKMPESVPIKTTPVEQVQKRVEQAPLISPVIEAPVVEIHRQVAVQVPVYVDQPQQNIPIKVESVVIEAEPLYRLNPPPSYPRAARRRNQQGTVILEVLVNKDGTVDELRVQSSSGHSVLDRAAEKAVKKWVFTPAMRGDEKISAWVQVPVRFNLRDKR